MCFRLIQHERDSLTGKWQFNINIDGLGEPSLLINIEKTSDSTFTAYSRQNAMKEIIGGAKQFMANLFVKQYKKGAFVRVFKGTIKDDSLRGIFTAPGIDNGLNPGRWDCCKNFLQKKIAVRNRVCVIYRCLR